MEEEQRLKDELKDCVLAHSYLFTVVGTMVAVPACVRGKSYNPLVYAALLGSMSDLLRSSLKCQEQRKALQEYETQHTGDRV